MRGRRTLENCCAGIYDCAEIPTCSEWGCEDHVDQTYRDWSDGLFNSEPSDAPGTPRRVFGTRYFLGEVNIGLIQSGIDSTGKGSLDP